MSGQHGVNGRGGGLRHLAPFYENEAEFRARILDFARAGLARGEPTLIAVPEGETRLLDGRADVMPQGLWCRDMADMGRNPARIIPELRAFIDQHPGQRVRFVGEPIWPGRSPAEICEATRHEALINLAFGRERLTILCPYDRAQLTPSAIAGARHTHPELLADDLQATIAGNGVPWQVPPDCDRPLPPPPASAESLRYSGDLGRVRRAVESHARRAGLAAGLSDDLVLAASEIAANTLGHARSDGLLHVWHDEEEVLCQLHDEGWITDPLAGRVRHGPESRGHGLFLVNQVCDLVELRTGQAGTTVRLHMGR
jgi:anti-sigma regulatory factor (Ser/Thr protein kinase)